MRLLTYILIFVFSMMLGGMQLAIISGKFYAQQKALKFQKIRQESNARLKSLTFTTADFQQLDIEKVGFGVIEFEHEGLMYDAFELAFSDGYVKLMVKSDPIDTTLNRALKTTKRWLGLKANLVKNEIFNFYFSFSPKDLILHFGNSQELNAVTQSSLLLITICAPSPPP